MGERELWGAWNMNGTASVVFQIPVTPGGMGGAPSTSPFLPLRTAHSAILKFWVCSLLNRPQHVVWGPMNAYPKTLDEMEALFKDETACLAYISALRWPSGFECPACGR